MVSSQGSTTAKQLKLLGKSGARLNYCNHGQKLYFEGSLQHLICDFSRLAERPFELSQLHGACDRLSEDPGTPSNPGL